MLSKKFIVWNTALLATALALSPRWAFAEAAAQIGDPPPSSDPTQPQPQPSQNAGLTVTTDGPEIAPATAPAIAAADQATAEEQKPAEPPPPKPRPFAATQVFLQTSMSTGTVFKAQQQTYNPTVEQGIFLLPRYTINKDFQLRARTVFTYEYTNSDSTTTRNEPRFSDTSVQLWYRGIPSFKGFNTLVGAQVAVPTSPESRARTMLVSPGLLAQVSRGVEHVLGGELFFLGGVNYSHPLYRFTTSGTRDETPYPFQCYGATSSCDGQLTGIANASDILSWTALVAGEWGKWSPALFFLGAHQWAYTFSDQPGVLRLEDRTSVRQSTYFSAWVDYNFNEWLTGEVGYFMQRNVLNESGKYGNPFFDRNQDTRVYLGANIKIDAFVNTVIQRNNGDPGVVRAQNNRGPALSAF